MTNDQLTMPNDYFRIAEAISFLDRNTRAELDDVAEAVGLSPFHFHRLFSRWAGTSPKRFQQFRNVVAARKLLGEGKSVLEATYAADLSGPGRLHDLMVSVDAVSPGEFKAKGKGLTIRWGVHQGPFGEFLLGILVFHEPMPTMRWFGFALIWVALVLFTVESLRHRSRTLRPETPATSISSRSPRCSRAIGSGSHGAR